MFWEKKKDGILLRVRLTPNASCRSIKGIFIDAAGEAYLKASVVSVPEKGKANKELTMLLAECLKLPKSAIELISGDTSHYKKFLVRGEIEKVASTLAELEKGAKQDEC